VVPHPPHLPDLAPCDFFVFPRIKIKTKWRRFDDVDTIKMSMTRELNGLSCADFHRCFQKWQELRAKSISSAGDYFEGNN
jgi:hypothetical protein